MAGFDQAGDRQGQRRVKGSDIASDNFQGGADIPVTASTDGATTENGRLRPLIQPKLSSPVLNLFQCLSVNSCRGIDGFFFETEKNSINEANPTAFQGNDRKMATALVKVF